MLTLESPKKLCKCCNDPWVPRREDVAACRTSVLTIEDAPAVDRDVTRGGRDWTSRVVHLAGLTTNDVEAEVITRLALNGYDWTSPRSGRRRAP